MVTNTYRAYQQQRPRNEIARIAVIINNSIRLVKGSPLGATLNVDGVPLQFQGSSFTVPEVSIIENNETDKGVLTFYRIGYDVRTIINMIGGREPVPVRILVYLGSESAPQQDQTFAVSGVTLTSREARLNLTTENLEKQGKADRIFDPEQYPALRFI